MSVDPRPQVSTLDNGLQLVLTELPYARSVSISIYLRAGQRYEAAPEDAGISHFVEHLCFKGTERRPGPRLVAAEIDSLGGSFNAATDRELTVYYGKVTPDRFPEALDLLVDMLRGSQCRDEEIERERGVILEELAAVEDAPDEHASVLLDGLLWPGEPLGRDIAGAPRSIDALSGERLRGYYRSQYVANAVVVSIAGALPAAEARERAANAVADWPAGEPAGWVPAGGQPPGPLLRLLEKETEQAHLGLGLRGLDSRDEDRHALALLSIVLGEGMSSRLFIRLREELGLCYDVHSSAAYLRDTGAFSVHAGVDPGQRGRDGARDRRRARLPAIADRGGRAGAREAAGALAHPAAAGGHALRLRLARLAAGAGPAAAPAGGGDRRLRAGHARGRRAGGAPPRARRSPAARRGRADRRRLRAGGRTAAGGLTRPAAGKRTGRPQAARRRSWFRG